jgi:ribosomal protein S8
MPKDHLSDFVTRFKNRRKDTLVLYNTKKIKEILNVLKKSKLIDFTVTDETFKFLTLNIKSNNIQSMQVMSKQSRHKYMNYNSLLTDPRLKQTLSFYILTNSEWGWITSTEALNKKVGGKVILWIKLFLD